MATPPRFSVGDRVRLSGDSEAVGTVLTPGQPVAGTYFYAALFPGEDEPSLYGEDDLVLVQTDPNNPVAWLLDQPLADAETFGEYLTVLKLSSRLTDVLYSFLSSRTVLRVYQFKPILKLLNSPYQRLLIADEVGLGKTIEAGLIWSELHSRMQLDRVLVVCPASLRRKWQLELERRFDREVPVILSPADLKELVERARRVETPRFTAIAGMEMLRQEQNLALLREVSPTFDLVIVDEAHHMRNTGTLSYELGEFLSEASDYLIFLTATPLNLGTPDLFNLIHLLVPEEFDDFALFDRILEPNQWINACLRKLRESFPPDAQEALALLRKVERTSQASRFKKNPIYREVVDELMLHPPTSAREVVALQKRVTDLNTLAYVYNRTRKRDLAERLAIREAVTLDVTWTDQEWNLYHAVKRYVLSRFRRLNRPGSAIGFATIMPERQAASCLPALRNYLLDSLQARRLAAELEEGEEEAPEELGGPDRLEEGERHAVEQLVSAAEELADKDTKFDVLDAHLQAILLKSSKSQVLIFSFFKATLAYLERRLRQQGYSVARMDGSTPRQTREELMDSFRDGAFQILLSSEVGAEGLDFEFCQYLFNYDLPWNPMRLEQRIGRLDRFGQLHQKIYIGNFHLPGTIDTDIFGRLYERIGIFQRSIGELEPILGPAVRELQLAVLTGGLTPDQQAREVERVANALEARRMQLEEFEETRARLVGQDEYVVERLNEVERQRRYITSEEIQRLFVGFLQRVVGGSFLLRPDPRDPRLFFFTANFRFAHLMRKHIRQPNAATLDLLTQLDAGAGLGVTFDPDTAYKRRTEFLNFRHPFIAGILDYYRTEGGPHRAGRLQFLGPRNGDYLFFIFDLKASGLVPQHRLVSVAVNLESRAVEEDVSEVVLPAISEQALETPSEKPLLHPDVVKLCFDSALGYAVGRKAELQEELDRTNAAIVVARQESLKQSLELRVRRLKETMSKVQDPRILRMKESQIRNLEGRIRAKLDTLEVQKQVNVSLRPLAGGFARVLHQSPSK